MTCYDWKGGIGTSSRKVNVNGIGYDGTKLNDQAVTVGVLVQANQGTYDELVVMGVPVGRIKGFPIPNLPDSSNRRSRKRSHSSIIVVIATDAPLQPHQLKRLARRGGWASPAQVQAPTTTPANSASRFQPLSRPMFSLVAIRVSSTSTTSTWTPFSPRRSRRPKRPSSTHFWPRRK